MVKAFKLFWEDLFEVYRVSNSFLKKHWLGYIILFVVLFFIELTYINFSLGHWSFDKKETVTTSTEDDI